MNEDFYIEHAQRVRHLAEKADPFTKKRLLDLAERYDLKAAAPSRAPRTIDIQLPLLRPASENHRKPPEV